MAVRIDLNVVIAVAGVDICGTRAAIPDAVITVAGEDVDWNGNRVVTMTTESS